MRKRRLRTGKLSVHWWARWQDHRGKPRTRSTGTADEDAARIIVNGWEKDDRQRVERLPLRTLLTRYGHKLSAADNTTEYVDDTLRMIRVVCDRDGWKLATDIEADGLTGFLVALKNEKDRTPRTLQKYIRAMKGFTGWLVKTEKLPRDPLASIKAPTPGKGNRRMLLPDEWPHLQTATAAAERYGMAGPARVLLYRVAIETGLRANELRSLTRASLVLDADRPFIVATAGSTKNRKRAEQFISAELAEALGELTICAEPKRPLFALPPKWDMADLLRADLAAARHAWLHAALPDLDEYVRREQSDFLVDENHGEQVLDFHALRHTCGAWLALAGASLNVVQKVMRHSTITLTIDTYGHLLPGARGPGGRRSGRLLRPERRADQGGAPCRRRAKRKEARAAREPRANGRRRRGAAEVLAAF